MRSSARRSSSTKATGIAALLATLLAGCSGGGGSAPSLGAMPATSNPAPPPVTISSDAVLPSPPGDPQLVESSVANRYPLQSYTPPQPVTTLFSDDFVAGAATGWSAASSAWSVVNAPATGAEYTSIEASTATFAGSTSWADYAVEAYVRPETMSGSRRGAALLARAVDANHFYQIEFVNETSGTRWELWRNDGGRYVSLSSGLYAFANDTRFFVQLRTFGSTISVSIADTAAGALKTVASIADSTYTHGRIGLRLWGGATSRFAHVRAWSDAPDPTATPSPGAMPTPPAPTSTPTPRATATPTSMPTPAATPTPGGSSYIAPPGSQPFPASPFDNAVSAPQIAPGSATMIARALNGDTSFLGKIQVSTHDLSTPTDGQTTVYIAHSTDPRYTIHCMYYSNCPLEGKVVNIPIGAIPGGNLGYRSFHDDGIHDQHMAVRNVDTQIETDTWLTPTPNGLGGTLNIGYGGMFPFASGGIGQGGATASGFALTQGRVRPVDLTAGRIPYALALATPCENGHVYPAFGDDGAHDTGCPPIGAHIWLDSTPAQIATSGADPYFQTILRALHEYGGYIGDRCACNLSVASEGGVAYQAFGLQNPWVPILAHFPSEVPSGPLGEYHVLVRSGTIDLGSHLHVIAN